MGVLQKGKATFPFWGTSINLITGLDPLSLQTTSEATYATLLPGISNLTNRLRYYGFYCWLLDFYCKKEKKGNSQEQYKFIRRAELMIAIIMRTERRSVTQITGSDFADDLIGERTGQSYDLAAGADKTAENLRVYWKYSSGAFGQYYYGAMRAISLVVSLTNDDRDMLYSVSEPQPQQKVSGKQLADAFDSSLSQPIKDLFYNNIKGGKLNQKDIPALLEYFYIDVVNSSNKEWPLYLSLLLDKDDPSEELEERFTYHRRETIIELIKTSIENNNEYDWYNLLLKAYDLKLSSTDTIKGWYAYQFNEYYQYGCGTILWGTLMHLYEFQQEQYVPSFISKWSKLVTKRICKDLALSPDNTLEEVLSSISSDRTVEDIYNSVKTRPEDSPSEAAAQGFVLLFKLLTDNREDVQELQHFIERKQMIRDGNMIDGILEINARMKDTLIDFVTHFIQRNIIYRHQMVALRKMGNGSLSTQKFIINEQYIRFIDTFPPRRTSPRMNALWNILKDLGIIDAESKLTSLSKQILMT